MAEVVAVSDDSSSPPNTPGPPSTPGSTPSHCSDTSSTDGKSDNCSICLGKLQNKSFTDGCFHQFCYVCLLEWSKVKTECPLCKQTFKSIIHSVKSVDVYEQHYLTPTENGSWGNQDGERFRYRSTLTAERLRNRNTLRDARLLRLEARAQAARLQPPRLHPRERARLQRQRQLASTSEFRRSLYIRGIRVIEVYIPGTRRLRDISATFFRNNPATTHRLVPWLNRELNVLLYNNERQVQLIIEFVIELVKQYEIQSEQFREQLVPFLGSRTSHFIHEFFHFAQCPYDLAGFDRHAVYNEHDAEEILVNSSSDDDDIVVVPHDNDHPEPGPVQIDLTGRSPEPHSERGFVVLEEPTPLLERVRNFLDTENGTGQSGWGSPTIEIDQLVPTRSLQVDSPPVVVESSQPDSQPLVLSDIPMPSTSEPVIEIVPGSAMARPASPIPDIKDLPPMSISETAKEVKIEFDSDTDSSGIMVLETLKPFHERTPVPLSSASDDDVNFAKYLKKKAKLKKRGSSVSSTHSKHKDSERNRQEKKSRDRQSSSRRDHQRHRSRSTSRSRQRSRSHSRSERIRRSRDRESSSRGDTHRHEYRSDSRSDRRHYDLTRSRSPVSRESFRRRADDYDYRRHEVSEYSRRYEERRHNDVRSRDQRDDYANDRRRDHHSRSPDSHARKDKSNEKRTSKKHVSEEANGSASRDKSDKKKEKEKNGRSEDKQYKDSSHDKRHKTGESSKTKYIEEPKDKHKKSKKKKKHKHTEKESTKSRDKSDDREKSKRRVVEVSDSSDSDLEFIRLVHRKHSSGHKSSSKTGKSRDNKLISDNAVSSTILNLSDDDDDDLFR